MVSFNDIHIHWDIRPLRIPSNKVTLIFAATIVPTLLKVILVIFTKEFMFSTRKRKQRPENFMKAISFK